MNSWKVLLLLFIPQIFLLLTACSDKHNASATDDVNRLRVARDQIINQKGDTIYLRGFGLGGMLHMENFIDGYPANEEAMRETLKKVLGEKKYNLYFDTFLKNYFTEPDA